MERADNGEIVRVDDGKLLARFEPIVRFNEGEFFLPASVESFVERCELWETTGTGRGRLLAPAGALDLDELVELTAGTLAAHHLRLVSKPATWRERSAWQLRRDRPRFQAETRLGRVGVLTRLVDAGARMSLLIRGSTPRGAQVAAALLDRERPDHGDHPYYGRVVRNAGYTVLQYWFFSYFNDWRSRAHGVNDHEGDWEQVTVYLAGDHDLTPAWVAFSAHDEVGADLRRRWDDPDLTVVDGTHPVVYAGLGSHAGAVLAGEYLITVRPSRLTRIRAIAGSVSRTLQPWTSSQSNAGVGVPFVEYSRGDGVAIGPGCPNAWRQVVIDDDTAWVQYYTGLWGNDTFDRYGGERGPAGPRYERDGQVRVSWADPVGWASLESVSPDDADASSVLAARLDELDTEADELRVARDVARRRLRADSIAGNVDCTTLEVELAALARQATEVDDTQRRLREMVDVARPAEHPHAHLSHRVEPLPTESKDRRRILRVWATISTPLLFAFLAVLVESGGPSIVISAAIGVVVVLGIEAFTRGQFATYLLRLVLLAIVVFASWLLVLALTAGWRDVLVFSLLGVAVALLVGNLREVGRN
jgi:hypothetical protein